MRKSKPKKRILLPDPKYNDTLVTRFVNNMMTRGKKSTAYDVFYEALDLVGKRAKDIEVNPLDIWKKALGSHRNTARPENFNQHEKPGSLFTKESRQFNER
jgi:ribosomal protein S7